MIRPWVQAVVALAVVSAGAAPARAADEVGLSLDGRSWTTDLSRPLFDPRMRWVPGDVETRSFWVRNQGPTAASLRVAVRTSDPGALIAEDDIEIAARVRDGRWVPLTGAGPAPDDRVLGDGPLAEGERVRVDLRARFVPWSTNRSERRTLPLVFVVRLSQAGPDGGDGPLPDTGSAVAPWLLWLGGALVTGGVGAVLAATRRREARDG